MKASQRPFNRKHEELMERAKHAPPGVRLTRQRELVDYVAALILPPSRRKRLHRGHRR